MQKTICLLPGDGIGPEIVAEAVKVLRAVEKKFGHSFTMTEALLGGAAIDAVGVPLPDATVEACKAADAVFLGAVGGPKWDTIDPAIRPERGLLGIRKALGLFANLRPATLFPELAGAADDRDRPFDQRRVHDLRLGRNRAVENIGDSYFDILHRLFVVHAVQTDFDFVQVFFQHAVGVFVHDERSASYIYVYGLFHDVAFLRLNDI